MGRGLIKTKVDPMTWKYTLNKDKTPIALRKAFYRPRTPLQVYYRLPADEEWSLGFMVYLDARLYFGPSLSEMQTDHLNYQDFCSIYDTEAELVECAQPYIQFNRQYEYASLRITTGVTAPDQLSSFGSPNVSASLEYLFYSLVFASTRVPGEMTAGDTHGSRRGARVQRARTAQLQPSAAQGCH